MARCYSATRVACCNLRKRPVIAAPRLSGTVRLGVVEEVAGGSLPSALGRFATFDPVQIGVSAELIEQLIRPVVGIALALGDSRVSKAHSGLRLDAS
jgi:hypothetical protein